MNICWSGSVTGESLSRILQNSSTGLNRMSKCLAECGFKRFAKFTLAGEGEMPKTFLAPEMVARGTEVH